MMVTFDLPEVPSVNNLYLNIRGRGGRVKTPQYRAWIEEAALKLNSQRVPLIRGKYFLLATFARKDKRRRDLGNKEKALSDILVSQGVIEDDSLAQEITLRWDQTGSIKGCRVELRHA